MLHRPAGNNSVISPPLSCRNYGGDTLRWAWSRRFSSLKGSDVVGDSLDTSETLAAKNEVLA